MYDPERVTYFAETDYRNTKTKFGIKAKDRTKHVYIIGKTGMGKSTLIENMAVQDIQNGEGMALIDPHGATAEKLLKYVPEHRIKDVIYFAPFDTEHPISFNIMEDVGHDKRHLVASGLMSAFKKIWADAWSARMEYILNNTILALLEYPGATLLGVNRMLSDKDYRKKVVDNITDPAVRSFWVDEFAKYTDRFAAEATPAIQNKVGQFTMNPLIRNIIGQPKSSFDIRDVMDNKKILIMNLSKGLVGEQNAKLLGSMLVTKIYLGAMSRADVPPEKLSQLPNFYFYVDEFQTFVNETFAEILSEARKYKLNLTIAHQYIEQMIDEVKAAVFGNVGTTIAFRVGPFDAEVLETIFSPSFTRTDLVNLGFAQIYLTLMIDGVGSSPFSATTLPPIPELTNSNKENIIESSRSLYARKRSEVEGDILKTLEKDEKSEKSTENISGRESFAKQVKDFGNGDRRPKPGFANTDQKQKAPVKPLPKPNPGEPSLSLKSLLTQLEKNETNGSNVGEEKTSDISDDKKNNIVISNISNIPKPKNPSFVLKKDMPHGFTNAKKPEIQKTVSLKDLSSENKNTVKFVNANNPISQKDASLEKKQSLKDALQKAMLEKNIFGASSPEDSKVNEETKIVYKQPENTQKTESLETPKNKVEETQTQKDPVETPKRKRQAPEELLKKVFE